MAKQGPQVSDRAIQVIARVIAGLFAVLLATTLWGSSIAAAELPWMNDLEKAKKVAAEQHQDLLINFTGTEWCEYCMRLDREILQKDELEPIADHFVLVRLEYPAGTPRLPQEAPAPHPTWTESYGVAGFPTVFLADETGKPYARTGYRNDKPVEYLQHLLKLQAVRKQRDDSFAAASKSSGIERARALASGLAALNAAFDYSNRDPLLQFYRHELDEIIELDADNSAGLREEYQQVVQRQADRDEKAAFYERLGDSFKQGGAQAAVRFLDERLSAPISAEFGKELRWNRLNYLEGERAISFAKQLSGEQAVTKAELLLLRRRIAKELGRIGRVDEAAAAYDEIVVDIGDDRQNLFFVLRDKADLYRDAQRYEDALKAFDAVIKQSDADTVPWSHVQAWRLHMLARLGRVDEAWSLHRELINSPVAPKKWRVSLLIVMATRFHENGSKETAQDAAAKAQATLDRVKDSLGDRTEVENLQLQIDGILAKLATASGDPPNAKTEEK